MNNLIRNTYFYKILHILSIILLTSNLLGAITLQAADSFISNYRLGSGDTIQIVVFDEEDLSLSILLGDTGAIKYPYLDQIKISGLTTNQVEKLITKGLKPDVLINPTVQVSILEYRPFFISGEINSPGDYPYQPGLTVSKALAIAGGLTERASESSISIVRATDTNQKSVKVSLTDPVYPGDILSIGESFF